MLYSVYSAVLKVERKCDMHCVTFSHSCWIPSWQYVRRSETGQTISGTEGTHSVLWLGSYGQKGWYVVYIMCSTTDADTEQGFYEDDSSQITSSAAEPHLSRGNCTISHKVLFFTFAPHITVCIYILSKWGCWEVMNIVGQLGYFIRFISSCLPFLKEYLWLPTAAGLCSVDIFA